MSYDLIYDIYKCFDIDWREPVSMRNKLLHDYDSQRRAFLYKIVARFGKSYSLLYIGKTYNNIPTKRLSNADHIQRKIVLEAKYPRHELMVSFGSIAVEMTEEILCDIENLLIYSHTEDAFPRLVNVRNRRRHKVVANYCLTNKGFRRDGMYNEVALAVFFKC